MTTKSISWRSVLRRAHAKSKCAQLRSKCAQSRRNVCAHIYALWVYAHAHAWIFMIFFVVNYNFMSFCLKFHKDPRFLTIYVFSRKIRGFIKPNFLIHFTSVEFENKIRIISNVLYLNKNSGPQDLHSNFLKIENCFSLRNHCHPITIVYSYFIKLHYFR